MQQVVTLTSRKPDEPGRVTIGGRFYVFIFVYNFPVR
jgi:hypothetical protein